MRQGPSPRMVGMFVVGAVALAVAAVMTFASGNLFARRYPFVVYFRQSVAGLDPGAPVKFMGVRVGTVRAVTLAISDRGRPLEDVRIPVIFEIDENLLIQEGLVGLSLADTARLRALIDEGMRVEMAVESFVTGRKFLSLVVRPDAPLDLVNDPGVPYLEVPAIRATGLEDLEGDVRAALGRLVRLDVDTVLAQMTRTLESIDRVANSELATSLERLPATLARADSTLEAFRLLATSMDDGLVTVRSDLSEAVNGAAGTADELRATLVALRGVAGPDSPLLVRLEETLTRLAAAGFAVEALAEYLARDPGALLRGKPDPEMR